MSVFSRTFLGKWQEAEMHCALVSVLACMRGTIPLPFWTTCLNFNRSCRRLVQRYYLRLPSVLSDTTSLAVPPRCNRTIPFPIVPETRRKKGYQEKLTRTQKSEMSERNLKDLWTTVYESFIDRFWMSFRRCNLICYFSRKSMTSIPTFSSLLDEA